MCFVLKHGGRKYGFRKRKMRERERGKKGDAYSSAEALVLPGLLTLLAVLACCWTLVQTQQDSNYI